MNDDQLRGLMAGLRLRSFEPGAAMVREHEPGESIFVLTRGRARVMVNAAHGGSFEVAELAEGSSFGEITVHGGPRTATVLAIGPCETLEIASSTLESLSLLRRAASEIVEHTLLQRASSPEMQAIRAVPRMEADTPARAVAVLDAQLGLKAWNPKMRLRLAELLARVGGYLDAVPVLVGLADQLQAGGHPARALAILHKIEVLARPADREIVIGSLPKTPGPQREKPGADILTFLSAGKPAPGAKAIDGFRRFLQELMREARGEAAPTLLGEDAEALMGELDFDRLAARAPALPAPVKCAPAAARKLVKTSGGRPPQ
jgi:CRP-like cAMP-binding protein